MSEDWNNELKIDFTVVTVPSLFLPTEGVKIFLAGSIDCDNDEHWREEIIEYIRTDWFEEKDNTESITIYSPRREEEWSFDMENEQAAWDISMMDAADYIILHLTGESVSPVSLLELGVFINSPKLFFSINDDYVRKNIALLYFSCYGYNRISKSPQESVVHIKNNYKG